MVMRMLIIHASLIWCDHRYTTKPTVFNKDPPTCTMMAAKSKSVDIMENYGHNVRHANHMLQVQTSGPTFHFTCGGNSYARGQPSMALL